MAAVWKGSISFGLVNIPVELQGAVSDKGPHFRLLHDKDKSPVSYERVCQREQKPVDWKNIVKGYEYSKGKYVVLTKEDFQSAALEKTKTVDIVDFVREDEIDDRFFDTSYYVVPGKGGTRGYAVLREAIRESGRVGVGRIVLRESQHLVALGVVDKALVLTVMRFADELVDVDRYTFPTAKDVRPKELEMARKLVESLAEEWKPEKYMDDYRANLMRIIKAKMKGKEPKLVGEKEPHRGEVVDLMERLRESLEGRAQSRPRAKTSRAKKAKSSRRAAA
jgi:DNA end-binding protein Ku